jgi:hypothetical protein
MMTKKSKFMVGAMLTDNSNKSKAIVMSFALNGAYFIRDRLALGISPSIGIGISKKSVLSWGIAPIMKYYSKNGFVLSSSLGYDCFHYEDHENIDLLEFNLGAGFAYFIQSKYSIEFSLHNNLGYYLDNTKTFVNILHFSLGVQRFI